MSPQELVRPPELIPLSELLELQQEIATRSQLLARGITDMMCYRHVRAGKWQRPLPATYALTDRPLGTEQRRIAARLRAGEQCQITGLAALHYYALRGVPSTDKVHVLVPHDHQIRSTGLLIVSRTLELDQTPRDAGLYWVASPARAVVDAGRLSGDLGMIRAIMTEVVQRNLATPKQLDEELRRAKRSRTAVTRRVLEEVLEGIRSAPEADLRDLLQTSKVISQVLYNPVLMTKDGVRLPTPDALLPDAWLALEVDSKRHHSPEADGWVRTLERHNALLAVGIDTLHIVPANLGRYPAQTLHTIEQAYLHRLGQVCQPPVVVIGHPR